MKINMELRSLERQQRAVRIKGRSITIQEGMRIQFHSIRVQSKTEKIATICLISRNLIRKKEEAH
jgi:hypothetical protein